MATIAQDLAAIRNAVYGKDVREAIADGIEQCYTDITTSATSADSAAKAANEAAAAANTAAQKGEALKTIDLDVANTVVISNGTNYNDIKPKVSSSSTGYNCGTYLVDSDANAASMTNCPTVKAHKLILMRINKVTPHGMQIVIDRDGSTKINNVYRRIYIYDNSGGTWGEWINDTTAISSVKTELSGKIGASTRTAILRVPAEITSGDNSVNTITIPAQWILCGNKEYHITEDVTVPYSKTNWYYRLIFNTTTQTFSEKSIWRTTSTYADLADDEYLVLAFNRQESDYTRKQFGLATGTGNYILDGKDKHLERIRMEGNFQSSGTDDCTYSWWVYPEAVYYEGMNKKIYYGYTDSKGYIGVCSIDLETNNIEKKILMKSATVYTQAQSDGSYKTVSASDNHNDCSVNVMSDGRILCVCSEHNTMAYTHIFVSTNPESVSEFTRQDLAISDGYGSVSYAQCIYCGGKYNLFVRSELGDGSHSWWHYSSSADGVTWTAFKPFLDGRSSDGSVSTKYYMRVSKDTDTRLKFFIQSNASAGASELRMGTFNVSSGNIMTNFGARVVGVVSSIAAPIAYDKFDIVVAKPDSGFQRLVAVGEGSDYSVVVCPITNPTTSTGHSYTTQYYRWNGKSYDGPYAMTSQGAEFGPNYQNGVDIVEKDKLVSCENTGNGWRVVAYNFANGAFTLAKTLDSSTNTNIKMFVPIKAEGSEYVLYNKGYTNASDFYNTRTKVAFAKYT